MKHLNNIAEKLHIVFDTCASSILEQFNSETPIIADDYRNTIKTPADKKACDDAVLQWKQTGKNPPAFTTSTGETVKLAMREFT